MKLTLERDALKTALDHASRVVERRTTIPILANILLDAREQRLALRATDLDIEIALSIPAEIAEDGALTLPAHTLKDIVAKLAGGARISLESDADAKASLKSGRARFSLQSLPAHDFPDLAAGDMPHRFSLPGTTLARLFGGCAFAVSDEETRYYLGGVYLHAIDIAGSVRLRAVATDGHRLARLDGPEAPEGAAGMPGVIVPRKTVAEIVKLSEAHPGPAAIDLSPTKIRIAFGGAGGSSRPKADSPPHDEKPNGPTLTSKLIDGTFPDYLRVIPAGNDRRLTVERDGFAAAVERVSVISSERGRAVKFAIGDGKLAMSVVNPDSGSASEEIEADYDSSPVEIGFNARYVLDILAEMASDTLLVKLSEPGSPTIFTPRDNADALYVLMPMRV